eukprot:CFRG7217T1
MQHRDKQFINHDMALSRGGRDIYDGNASKLNITELFADDGQDKLEELLDMLAGSATASIPPSQPITSYYETFDYCTINATQKCDMTYLRENQSTNKSAWIILPGNNTRCLDGSPFGFTVFPGNISNENTLFWFQGGGACFDYDTCFKIGTATTSFVPETNGIFNYTRTANPIGGKGWTTVVNNYCSGDIFMGSGKQPTFTDSPYSNNSGTVDYYGAINTVTVLAWLERQAEAKPKNKLAVGGCSAGSVGTQLWAEYMNKKFNATHFILDSYIGDFTHSASSDLTVMGMCDTGATLLNWESNLIEQCRAGNLSELKTVFEPTLQNMENAVVAYVGSLDDIVQKAYYVIMANNNDSDIQPFLSAYFEISAAFTSYLYTTLEEYHKIDSQFSYYLVDSSQHCFLPLQLLYNSTVTTAQDGGNYTMLDFIDDFLNNGVYGQSYGKQNVTQPTPPNSTQVIKRTIA